MDTFDQLTDGNIKSVNGDSKKLEEIERAAKSAVDAELSRLQAQVILNMAAARQQEVKELNEKLGEQNDQIIRLEDTVKQQKKTINDRHGAIYQMALDLKHKQSLARYFSLASSAAVSEEEWDRFVDAVLLSETAEVDPDSHFEPLVLLEPWDANDIAADSKTPASSFTGHTRPVRGIESWSSTSQLDHSIVNALRTVGLHKPRQRERDQCARTRMCRQGV
ncbi:hypothetical protein QBC44DRAFT_372383 [Cladorrhinum sp. PSN332]|nr:hypothetical protein QBC44DRAFT_372383 [Cladorrhinum sp. PSN332]